MRRKHISWKTKCAAALTEVDYLRGQLALVRGTSYRRIPYDHAKVMTEDQYHSLWHWDHNKLHAFDGGDHFSNFTPMSIRAHRAKTKKDAKIIAKSRRLRENPLVLMAEANPLVLMAEANPLVLMAEAVSAGFAEGARKAYDRLDSARDSYAENYSAIDWSKKPKRKIRSRGFDKTKRRKMSGEVVPR